MRNTFVILSAVCVVGGVCVAGALGPRAGQDVGEGDFAIYVSPGTIITDGPCQDVTIHTEVRFNAEIAATVVVNEQNINASTFSDSRGNLVAKVDFADVVEMILSGNDPEPTEVEITLVLSTEGGKPQSASEIVPVR